MIGRVLAHYEVVGSLGKGGMGEVFVAEDRKLQRRVALIIVLFVLFVWLEGFVVADLDRRPGPDKDEFMQTDTSFHTIIMSTTGMTRLPAAVRSLSPHLDRARLLLVPEPGRTGDTVEEHVAIHDALLRQDRVAAEDAMRHHVRQLLRRLEPLEAERPDLFSR